MFDPNQPQMVSMRNYLIQLLQRTLEPTMIKQATSELQLMTRTPQMGSNLIFISGQQSIEPHIRMAALVFLKNMVQVQFKDWSLRFIMDEDFQILKNSIFPMLVHLVQRNETKLLPTMKKICYLFGKHLYKENKWDSLIPQLLTHLELCESFETVKATLIMIKILFKILGKSLTEEIKLNNLSTKIILPLVTLASKMYANLSVFSCVSLEEVFKILTEVIEFHLPEVVHKNIHMFMVLVKNVLDLKVDEINLENIQQYESIAKVLRIKRQALIFLKKLYERHSTTNILQLQPFVIEFNQKYTRPYFQTIVAIILGKATLVPHIKTQQPQVISTLHFSLITHALGIFSFITGNFQSSKYIEEDLQKYQLKILYLSMEKFLNCHSKKLENKIEANMKKEQLFENYTDFLEIFREERLSLRLFLSSIFSNKKIENRQKNVEEILNLLLKCVTEGSLIEKELALYLLSSLQRDIQALSLETYQSLNQKMIIFLKEYVFPLLNINLQGFSNKDLFFAKLIKLRAFQMYRRFEFIQIGQKHSIELCQKIFEELSSANGSQIDIFVKIQAVETFNQILGTDHSLIPKLVCRIPQLLSIYTDLLTKDFEVMKYYEEILSMFSQYISPVVHEILELLCDMFFKLVDEKMMKFNCLSGQWKYGRGKINGLQEDDTDFEEEEILQQSDNQTIYEDIAHDYDNIGSQCLASIKKLIFKHVLNTTPQYNNQPVLKQKLLLVVIHGLSSKDEQFIKQTLAIINLLLYKNYIPQNLHFLLPVLLYPVFITSNPKFAQQIRAYVQQSSYSKTQFNQELKKDFNSAFIGLLETVRKDIVSRTFAIFDEIGCLKNFIKVLGKGLYQYQCPISHKTYLQMLIQAVIMIEQSPDQQAYSEGEVKSVLSIYQVLLQNKTFLPSSLHPTYTPDIYLQTLIKNIVKWSILIENSTFQPKTKQQFQSFYLRIAMIILYAYPFEFYKFFEIHILGNYVAVLNNDYPVENVFGELGKFVVDKTVASLQTMAKLKEKSHLLNDTYVTFEGISSLLSTLVKYFIIQNQTTIILSIEERLKIINQHSNFFFSRMYFILVKLSFQLVFLTTKECDYQTVEFDQFYKAEKVLDKLIINGVGKVNVGSKATNQIGVVEEANTLIDMLSKLTIMPEHSSQTSQNSTQSQLSPSRQPKYEVKYQHDLKFSQSMMQGSEFSSDESDLGSFDQSDDSNPFECGEEEYLYAYDSVIFGGSFLDSKQTTLGKILREIQNVYSSHEMDLLRRVFQAVI